MDDRYEQLARVLTRHSLSLGKDDHLLIDAAGVPDEIVIAIIREARSRGSIAHATFRHTPVTRELLRKGTEEQFKQENAWELYRMKRVDAYLALRGSDNVFEMADVPTERMQAYSRILRPTLDYRVRKTRWCVLRWPNPAMAQQAGMSTEAFADFYFRVCTFDYASMKSGMRALQRLMERTDRVEIQGPGTDLSFSIAGIPAVACGGTHNIPDGEVFTAPVKDSVEGTLYYNAPTVYQGFTFKDVRLTFRKGQIVEATANDSKRLQRILDADPGGRYIGEFAIGFHPLIREPMGDILFDEKIDGSFHFTPGQAYEDADNGNRSQVHWDMVSIQRRGYGGGTIAFDGKVIRRDGVFLPKALQGLNRESLLARREKSATSSAGRPKQG